eukprot:CAMPEP_0180041474 /NCGR_PEP_ID=MMETSP0984-20121128/34146_1 /TAXON_ID=483367 /ORGANISM="non described non described, Strain CCMP 2436" /LENGTH=163 /DNA_ID=CAMNT_0021969051 /DNA_START=464 /DNA_END=955 /DNA_ORIENTATION=-
MLRAPAAGGLGPSPDAPLCSRPLVRDAVYRRDKAEALSAPTAGLPARGRAVLRRGWRRQRLVVRRGAAAAHRPPAGRLARVSLLLAPPAHLVVRLLELAQEHAECAEDRLRLRLRGVLAEEPHETCGAALELLEVRLELLRHEREAEERKAEGKDKREMEREA